MKNFEKLHFSDVNQLEEISDLWSEPNVTFKCVTTQNMVMDIKKNHIL